MARTQHPVRYITKQRLQQIGISLDVYPSAGPYPNVTGMRRTYYGQDAYLVRHGAYVYHVSAHIWAAATDYNQ